MGQPRFFRGSPVSAAGLNSMALELDLQGLACSVYRSSPVTAQSANVDRIVSWQVEDYDTFGGGMWDPTAPTYVRVRYPGVYLMEAQLRWSYLSTGSPYNTGQRAGKLLVNSTNVASTDINSGPVKSDKATWSVDGEGVTLTLIKSRPLYAGDRVYVNYWHSASGSIDCLHQDFGGTYLSVTRTGALV